MKYKLMCIVFGHNFVGKYGHRIGAGGNLEWSLRQTDWCTKCGLSKKEIFTGHSNQLEK